MKVGVRKLQGNRGSAPCTRCLTKIVSPTCYGILCDCGKVHMYCWDCSCRATSELYDWGRKSRHVKKKKKTCAVSWYVLSRIEK